MRLSPNRNLVDDASQFIKGANEEFVSHLYQFCNETFWDDKCDANGKRWFVDEKYARLDT